MPNDGFIARLKSAFNVFMNPEDREVRYDIGPGHSTRQDKTRMSPTTERSIAVTIYNRVSMDVAAIPLRHVRLDENERYLETVNSGLNRCLSFSANVDQTGRAFIQDVVMSMFDEGHVVLVPVDTSTNPRDSASFDILSMRTGKVVDWYPRDVRVEVYNDRLGRKEQITLPKTRVSIIENPFYAVMNEPNSILKRLVRKMSQLDAVDDISSSGKLDIIFQLPYVIKTEARKQQAEERKKSIEDQLSGSRYGIAYVDATEKITQLNRPAENNLMTQIEFLTRMLYSQLGLDETVFLGTADEKTMINYFYRSIEPVLSAIGDGIKRSFLSSTAISQGQSIRYYRDPFRYVSAADLASASDAFTRNEILSSNEIRDIIGRKPSDEEGADSLRNKNLNQPEPEQKQVQGGPNNGQL